MGNICGKQKADPFAQPGRRLDSAPAQNTSAAVPASVTVGSPGSPSSPGPVSPYRTQSSPTKVGGPPRTLGGGGASAGGASPSASGSAAPDSPSDARRKAAAAAEVIMTNKNYNSLPIPHAHAYAKKRKKKYANTIRPGTRSPRSAKEERHRQDQQGVVAEARHAYGAAVQGGGRERPQPAVRLSLHYQH
ncbi:hypothetical protein B0T26DRAFT_42941 [Lasiosphaeria miniovina]|uniref:Uncharacterized protein n=1 Tax=Lasiosphaeria miniovina TaxID=1954250 RepID=A0AA40BGN4_9PEZI|nr:uncharacterized protein B0T26DRAFT_42941 [Lasiosphaeria miniovina]KAK0733892.1 hypothetical protein B0T26DRAFT_42941 [Lasiosphaeria miniovina]